MRIMIVIPAFNEAKRIENLLDALKGVDFPVILVDDGSSDKTFELAEKYPITVLRHKVNLGKGAALKTGCLAAFKKGAEAVILMDSDGQHEASDIQKFISALESKKFDLVLGSRNLNLGVPLVRFIGNKFASVLINILFGIYVSDLICGFRGMTKKAFERINWKSQGYDVETEMIVRIKKLNLRYCEVSVETVYYDKFKGVTILDALNTLINVFKWRLSG